MIMCRYYLSIVYKDVSIVSNGDSISYNNEYW